MNTAERERLIRDHVPMVRRMASHMMLRLPPSVSVDDLTQAGLLGLLDAAGKYDAGQNVPFGVFASQRVRGAMIDELRQIDWLPRSVRSGHKRIEAAIAGLEQELGRAPTEAETAAALDMKLEDYQHLLQDARGHQLLYYEDFGRKDDDGSGDADFFDSHLVDDIDPLAILSDHRFRQQIVDAIARLPEREKLVMALYYDEELTLREIGDVLGVTESRVCQIHSQAISRLRAGLGDWL